MPLCVITVIRIRSLTTSDVGICTEEKSGLYLNCLRSYYMIIWGQWH